MNIQTTRQNNEHIFVLRTWREQQFARCKVAAIATLQQILYVIGQNAFEQREAIEQREFVIGVYDECLLQRSVPLCQGGIVTLTAPYICRPDHKFSCN